MITICKRFTIDGLVINLHDLTIPMAGPRDLHTAVVISTAVHVSQEQYGLSVQLTEITEDLADHELSRRVETPYFKKKLLEEFSYSYIVPVDIDNVVAQLARATAIASDKNKRMGRLYSQDSDTFAKMTLNDVWSVNIFTKGDKFNGVREADGLWGRFTCLGIDDGMFQLAHRTSLLGSVSTPFTHCGKVLVSKVDEVQHWLKAEFLERWGGLLSQTVKESIGFTFDGNLRAVQLKKPQRLHTEQYHVGKAIQIGALPSGFSSTMDLYSAHEHKLLKLSPGVEIQVLGTVSTITDTILLDTPTDAGTWLIIRSKADDGETFMFLVGARHTDEVYSEGIPVRELSTVLFTV